MPGEPGGRRFEHVDVGQENHHQDGEEHQRVDQPGAPKQERELDHRLGFKEQEARSQEKHSAVHLDPDLGEEEVDHRHSQEPQHEHGTDCQRWDQLSAEIRKRPIIAGRE